MKRLLGMLLIATALLGGGSARAESQIPPELRGIEIEERLGAQVPRDAALVDHEGQARRLGDYLKPGRPVLLTLNYYSCPTLCSLLLNGVVDGLRGLGFTIGKEFDVVTLSIDHREGPELAGKKRSAYLASLGRPVAASGWPFLVGREAEIARVAQSVGFHYRYDQETKQFAHAAGIFVLTPDGRVSRILYGIEFPTRDLRLALVEASHGGIGSPVDRLLLFCYHYDPQSRRYLVTPMGVMRIGGVLFVVVLGLFPLAAWRRERRASVSV